MHKPCNETIRRDYKRVRKFIKNYCNCKKAMLHYRNDIERMIKMKLKNFTITMLTIITALAIAFLIGKKAYEKGYQEASETNKVNNELLAEAEDTIESNRNTIADLNKKLDSYATIKADFVIVESDTKKLYVYPIDNDKKTIRTFKVDEGIGLEAVNK